MRSYMVKKCLCNCEPKNVCILIDTDKDTKASKFDMQYIICLKSYYMLHIHTMQMMCGISKRMT